MNGPIAKLRWIYALLLVFVAAVVAQMAAFAYHQIASGEPPYLSAIAVLVDLVIVYTIVRAAWRCAKQIYWSRVWHKRFRSSMHGRLTKRLNYKYRSWGTEIIVVRDAAFIALTIGTLRPRIVVSTALFEMFGDKEIEAILLHEWHHCRNRDGLKLLASAVLEDAFGYWPIIKPIVGHYRTWKELFADRFAIRRMGTELYLGNVLLKLAKLGDIRQREGAVHFADGTMQYRIMQVLEPGRAVKVPLSLLRPLLVSCSLLLLLMLGGDS